MSLILNIDTTSEQALVNVAREGVVLCEEVNEQQRDHASFLHPAIIAVLKKSGLVIGNIDAVAVSHGPGSYTGIRVGVAAAKGICYAAEKPLITINQLEILAKDAIDNSHGNTGVYCALMDARRMEVFTALYNNDLKELMPPAALVLQHHSFHEFLSVGKVFFVGSGSTKWQQLCTHENAQFKKVVNKGLAFAGLSHQSYGQRTFASLAYTGPLYIKEFYSTIVDR